MNFYIQKITNNKGKIKKQNIDEESFFKVFKKIKFIKINNIKKYDYNETNFIDYIKSIEI